MGKFGQHPIHLPYGLITAIWGLCAAGCSPLLAQDQKIFQMIHTAWTARDGAPENIHSIAQTSDGMLWLSTHDGLFSFDGLTFSLFDPGSGPLHRQNIPYMFAPKDGSLWVYGVPPATRIQNGVAAVMNRGDHGVIGSLSHMQQSSDGTLWAVSNQRDLMRFGSEAIWHVVPTPTKARLESIFVDSSDTLWLVSDNKLYRRAQGQEAFQSCEVPVYGPANLQEGLDHSVWIAGSKPATVPTQHAGQPPEVGLKRVDRFGKRLPNPLPKSDVNNMVVARDGSVWLSHTEAGLQRLRPAEFEGRSGDGDPPDLYGVSDGLTTTGFRGLLLDRDGNIWISGGKGLDRFQHATLVPAVPNAINGGWSFCVAPNDDVWVTVFDDFRAIIRNGRLLRRLKDLPGIQAMLCEKDGTVRGISADRYSIAIRNGRDYRLPPVLDDQGEPHFTMGIVTTPNHRMIAVTNTQHALWTFEGGRWAPFLVSSGISHLTAAAMADAEKRLYLGSRDGKVTVLDAATFEVVASSSIALGVILGFSETSYGVFAVGQYGIALQCNGVFRKLSFANSDLALRVSGLVEDHQGDVWINGLALARISAAEIRAAISDLSHPIRAREFREGAYRGSDSFASFPYAAHSAQIDSKGILWFSTSNGVIYIDPRHVDHTLPPPQTTIRSITADGKPLKADRTFRAGVQTLNVRYLGLNLSNPSGVVYRYRLEGFDESWQNVGNRAEAFYTRPHPGKYTFQVEAANSGEDWSAPVYSAAFVILPLFYQTWWFEALSAVMGLVVLWLAVTARTRSVAAAAKMRAEERAEERVRIARELHDTLLQGVQGLSLSFHVAAEKVPDSHEAKQALEKALATADRIILEGRDRVNRLRSDRLASSEFEPSIQALADDLKSRFSVEFAMEYAGHREPLNPDILEEIYYIAQEALTNAFRHSGGSRIVLKLDYGRSHFSMECRDDGRGFGAGELREAESKGHWGFRGMSERAEQIGAKLIHESAPGNGTTIRLVLRSGRAYLRDRSLRMLFRFYRPG